ncbi:lipid A biosynthesis lauroyl acyltransferase [Chryseobacterium taklimakanense]|uniref:Lipid A biosynthesis lauroyl acyltransferase n=1 Tax=Chryseobacterium taklimakanense TaxID=536441 RepID=A0A239WRH7_9FLAO|nr:lysophospholipid acyltransferase family protein [Chryseobacterium taklimakanense]SNV36786.1 lipid A biosynthesis lauroyl acyltransferase [Chryseobacterium taklimakanense]
MKTVFALVILLSKLPLKILYIFSDILYFLMYHVIGYRKNVVYENLKNSFPEKNREELKEIEQKFYSNFSDYIVETLKAFTITSEELRVRVQHINQDVFHQAKDEGKNIILLSGHIFNWEWFNALATIIPQEKSFPVYKKMNSDFWEEKIKNIRNKYGNHALEAGEVTRHLIKNKNDGNSIYMFVADQSPYALDISYGLKFLNQLTPAFTGYDRLATKMDLIFVYCEMKKVKRGFYQVNYYRIYPDSEKFEPFEVVKKFHKLLENTIQKRPDNWLWSHKRWKYKSVLLEKGYKEQ